jgi:hypothetical protein
MKSYGAGLLIAAASILCLAGAAQAAPISPLERQECHEDYKKFCADYGLDTPALRACMDRAGKSLSKGCVNALIQAGEVSQAEVERRK